MAEGLAAIVLAGGRSTRFGADKASALLRGKPLLTWVVRAASATCREIVVVAAEGQVLPAVEQATRVVTDPEPGLGPLAGLATGLRAVSVPLAFAVACDTPLLAPGLIPLLAGELGDADAVLCETDGYRHPLGALYRVAAALPAFDAALAAGERRLLGAVERLRPRVLSEDIVRAVDPDLRSFRNANRREDLAALAAALADGGGGELFPG
jgi:molybdopterin-guanine dinucleotide biosynthesis protein A